MICDTLEHLTLYQGFHKNLDTAALRWTVTRYSST